MRKKLCDCDYPSEKQLSYIGAIERRLNVLFTGKTKQDACEFISKYVDRFKAYNYTFDEEKYKREREETRREQDREYRKRQNNKWWEQDPYEYDLCPFSDGWGGA